MWELSTRRPRFDIVEVGAGNGTLCRDVLSWAQRAAPELFDAVSLYDRRTDPRAPRRNSRPGVESDGLRSHVQWLAEMPAEIEGCIVTNELLDSMPVHRVAMTEGASPGDLRQLGRCSLRRRVA